MKRTILVAGTNDRDMLYFEIQYKRFAFFPLVVGDQDAGCAYVVVGRVRTKEKTTLVHRFCCFFSRRPFYTRADEGDFKEKNSTTLIFNSRLVHKRE